MTREEAIEELYRIIENQYRSAEKDKEALGMAIEALEQEPDEDYANKLRFGIILRFLNLRDIAGCYPDRPKRASRKLKKFLKDYGYDDEELTWADNDMFVKGWYCASYALYEGLEKILTELCATEKESEE